MTVGSDGEFDLLIALGAKDASSLQRFAIYLPNKDRNSQEIVDIETWIEAGLGILVEVIGGVTRLPPAQGRFRIVEDGGSESVVQEETVVIYSYVFDAGSFISRFAEITAFLHTFGKCTNQKSVMVEFLGENPDGGSYTRAYYIEEYPMAV